MTKYLLYLYQCDKCSKPKKCELRIFGSSAKPDSIPCIFATGYCAKWKLVKKIGVR
jgi:hypothetical protein